MSTDMAASTKIELVTYLTTLYQLIYATGGDMDDEHHIKTLMDIGMESIHREIVGRRPIGNRGRDYIYGRLRTAYGKGKAPRFIIRLAHTVGRALEEATQILQTNYEQIPEQEKEGAREALKRAEPILRGPSMY